MRSKDWGFVLLVYLLVPLAVGLLLGYTMSSEQVYDIPVAVADHDQSEFSRLLTDYIAENETFTLVARPESDADIQAMIDQGTARAGVIIPDGLSAAIRAGEEAKIMVVYDGSAMVISGAAKSEINEILLTAKGAYMQQLYSSQSDMASYQALRQAQPIAAVYRVLYNPVKSYRNFFLPGMLIALLQVGLALVGLERARDRRDGPVAAVGKVLWWGSMGTLAILVTLAVQWWLFNMPLRGSIPGMLALTWLFATVQTGFGFFLGRLIPDRVLASQVTSLLVLPTGILGGYTFPLIAMYDFFQKISFFMPFAVYGNALRALCLKNMQWRHCWPAIEHMLLLTLLVLGLVLLITTLQTRRREPADLSARGGCYAEN